MKKTLAIFVAILLYCGVPAAQELPDDILADQYLMAATAALQNQDRQAAISAFQKIEALTVTPPDEFFYFYGKVLVENGAATANLQSIEKGQVLLKKYVAALGREAEHYRSALEVLNTVEQQKLLARVSALMVRVPGGTFTSGCPRWGNCDEGYQVQESSFELSRYEVTQELWKAVMGELPSFQNCPQCPVVSVSWNDVQDFLRKLNAGGGRYRLPSEAEWEYAARGGRRSRGYQYAGSDNEDDISWYLGNSGDKIHQVGLKQRNELGLHDMSGNVWEWVQDCWYEDREVPSDGRARESEDCLDRVLRGGAKDTDSLSLCLAVRNKGATDGRYSTVGFRIARKLN